MADDAKRRAREIKAAFVAARSDNAKRLAEAAHYLQGLDVRDDNGLTLLMNAARRNACEAVSFLVSSGANVNLVDCVRRSALFHAALFGKSEAAALLIESGANLLHRDKWGGSCLSAARRPESLATYVLIRRAMILRGVVLDEDAGVLKLDAFNLALKDEAHLGIKEHDLDSLEVQRLRSYAVHESFAIGSA